MVTIFKSYGLWSLVEKRILIFDSKKKTKTSEEILDEEADEKMTAIFMKDAKALGITQNAVFDFHESQMQTLRNWNGSCCMENTMVEIMSDRLVQKVLINLSKVYDPICLVIENTRSLETMELQEVLAILKSQEQRFELHSVDTSEKAFASFTVSSKGQNKNVAQSGSSKFQKNWNSKGKKCESKGKPQQGNSA
ncbi:hypothetical protein L3X38_033461 [Prunus dulcis]|uniref:Uncharacterized protein n=1 Tax=Prunus dulcis TaxID=3755 RepID=A0AAD4VH49_PRUDU|nr:hypothetical protein L3X38_033461 [Prunus dulcis]